MTLRPRHALPLWLCWVLIGQQSAAESRPFVYLMLDGEAPEISLAPDGKHFAMQVGGTDTAGLVIVDVESGETVNSFATRLDRPLQRFRWISPEALIVQVADPDAPSGNLLLMGIRGNRPRALLSYRATLEPRSRMSGIRQRSFALGEVIRTLQEEPGNILLAEWPLRAQGGSWAADPDRSMRIRRLNVGRRQTTLVETLPLANAAVVLDDTDNPRFALGCDGGGAPVAGVKSEPDGPWATVALPEFAAVTSLPQRLRVEGRSARFLGRKAGAARNGLYRMDLASGAVIEDFLHQTLDIEDVVHDFSKQEIIGVRLAGPFPQVHWLEPEHPAVVLHQELARAFGDREVRVVSSTPDGVRAVLGVFADDQTGEYFLFDRQTLQARLIVSLVNAHDFA